MSAVSGWLVDVVGWRGMFIIEGLPAIAWAFAFRALVEDHPRSARWLAEDEREDIERRLEHEADADAQRRPSARDYVQALKERNVVLLALQYLLWSVGVYGFVFWLPTIVKVGSGYGIAATGLLSAIPYAFAAAAMLADSYGSDRVRRRRHRPRERLRRPRRVRRRLRRRLGHRLGRARRRLPADGRLAAGRGPADHRRARPHARAAARAALRPRAGVR
jgi:sugar phosphate permease